MPTLSGQLSAADRLLDGDLASDRELLDRFTRSGDQQAFEALVRRHGPRVLGVCRRVLRDDHAAEDAFQTTFLVLARKGGSLARPDALGGWLYGVACRVAAKARRTAPPPLSVEPATDGPDLAREELARVLYEELGQLPDRDRELLVLVYFEGRSHDEAAQAVGCPVGSVAWRLGQARAALRRRLVRRGVGLAVGAVLLLASLGRAQAVTERLVHGTVAAARADQPWRTDPTPVRGPMTRWTALVALLLALLGGGGVFAVYARSRAAVKPPTGPPVPVAVEHDPAECVPPGPRATTAD